MKKLKKIIPFLLALAMCGGVFAGCNGSGNNNQDDGGVNSGDNSGNTGDNTGGNTGGNNGGNTGDNNGGSQTPAEHTHTYSNDWTNAGEEGHYHMATCEHTEEHDELKPHRYTDDASTTCLDCGYVREVEDVPTAVDQSKPLASSAKIYVVGDSTVSSFSDNYYLPCYGYGTQIAEYINATSSQVVNIALSGRSSKSYLTENNYAALTSSIKEGDYLIIGFGHNDEKSDDDARFTDPNGTKDTELINGKTSLKWCLYEKYIKVAKDKGATPILCTPITRYDSTGKYEGSVVHVTAAGDYPKAIIELGAETDTTVIDLCKITSELYKADNEAAKLYHAHPTYFTATNDDIKEINTYDGTEQPLDMDATHINKFGAKMVVYQFAKALKKTDCPLAENVRTNKAKPGKETDYVGAINQKYKKPPYNGFDPSKNESIMLAGLKCEDTSSQWYKAAMGRFGGDKAKEFEFSYNKLTDTFEINAKNTGSKFASDGDGFGAIFTQIDSSVNFTATVKATVVKTAASASDQCVFGLMLRDDIYVEGKENTALTSNFVSASVTTKGKTNLKRDEKGLEYTGSVDYALNTEYELTLSKVGQVVDVTVKVGDKVVTTKHTDFDFFAIDNGKMYLCLFANRGIQARFSGLTYKITGTSQGA